MIYLVLVDRFVNGDPRNDRIIDTEDPSAFHGGDLEGVRQRLDELAALGVTQLWLSPTWKMRTLPFFEHGAFHGYWTEDIRRMEPRFGDACTLRRLGREARERGIGLVLDMVYNHVAPEGRWTRSHPAWFHPSAPITDWQDPVQLQQHQVHGLPDLDSDVPAVRRLMLRATRKWVRVARPEALRIDAVRHLDPDFLRLLPAELGPARPRLLGEIFDGNPASVARGVREAGLDAAFDFPMHYALVDHFCREADPGAIGAVLGVDDQYPHGTTLVPFLDNHDTPRIASQCGGDAGRVGEALTALFALRGQPMISWGTEGLLQGAAEPQNRGDLPAEQPLRETIARLAAMRAASPALSEGDSWTLDWQPGRYRFVREAAGEQWRVSIGGGVQVERVAGLRRPERLRVRLEGEPGTRIVGSRPEIGAWDPAAGVELPAELDLPPEVVAYKLVRRGAEGWEWEEGPNRYLGPPPTGP